MNGARQPSNGRSVRFDLDSDEPAPELVSDDEYGNLNGNDAFDSDSDEENEFYDAPEYTQTPGRSLDDGDAKDTPCEPRKRQRLKEPLHDRGVKRDAADANRNTPYHPGGRAAYGRKVTSSSGASTSDTDPDENSFVKQQLPPRKRTRKDDEKSYNAAYRRARQAKREKSRRAAPRSSTGSHINFVLSHLPPGWEAATIRETGARVEYYRNDGNAHHRNEDYDRAIESYTCALEIYLKMMREIDVPGSSISLPPPAFLWTNRAASYMSAGKYDLAVADMKSALSIQSEDLEAYVKRLGRLLRCYIAMLDFESADVQSAVDETQKCLQTLKSRQIDNDKDASSMTRRLVAETQKTLASLQAAIGAISAVQTNRVAGLWLAVLDNIESLLALAAGRTGLAVVQEWLCIKAEALGMLGRPEEGQNLIPQLANRTQAGQPEALWLSAVFAYASGDTKSCYDHLSRLQIQAKLPDQAFALQQRAYRVTTLLNDAYLYTMAANSAKALACFAEILRFTPSDQPAHAQVGIKTLLHRMKLYTVADDGGVVKHFDELSRDCRSIVHHPLARPHHQAEAFKLRALALHQKKEYAAAVSELQAALRYALKSKSRNNADVEEIYKLMRQWQQEDVRRRYEDESRRFRAEAEEARSKARPSHSARTQSKPQVPPTWPPNPPPQTPYPEYPQYPPPPHRQPGPQTQSRPQQRPQARPRPQARTDPPPRSQPQPQPPPQPKASPTLTAYEILGVPDSATFKQVRKAYLELSLKTHPDKGGDAELFKRISGAYSTLETQLKGKDDKGSSST